MKKILQFFLVLGIGLLLFSCSNDDDGFNTVTIKVYCNTPGVPVRVTGLGSKGYLTIKDFYEETFRTEVRRFTLKARCDDEDALVTIEIYVNGKLSQKRSDNSFLSILEILK